MGAACGATEGQRHGAVLAVLSHDHFLAAEPCIVAGAALTAAQGSSAHECREQVQRSSPRRRHLRQVPARLTIFSLPASPQQGRAERCHLENRRCARWQRIGERDESKAGQRPGPMKLPRAHEACQNESGEQTCDEPAAGVYRPVQELLDRGRPADRRGG